MVEEREVVPGFSNREANVRCWIRLRDLLVIKGILDEVDLDGDNERRVVALVDKIVENQRKRNLEQKTSNLRREPRAPGERRGSRRR